MPFHLYMNSTFSFRHENLQLERALKWLRLRYARSREYCYCLANVRYSSVSGSNSGQFDVIVLERRCVSIIELKCKQGKLSGVLKLSRGNPDLTIQFPNGIEEAISIQQIENQRDYLLPYLSDEFRLKRGKSLEEKYRIDSYLVLKDGSTFEGVDFSGGVVGLWLFLTTESDLQHQFETRTREQPFQLTEEDIRYIATQKFGLNEVDPRNYFLRTKSATHLLSGMISDIAQRSDTEFVETSLRDLVCTDVSEEELNSVIGFLRDRSPAHFDPNNPKWVEMSRATHAIPVDEPVVVALERLSANRLIELIIYMVRVVVGLYLRQPQEKDSEPTDSTSDLLDIVQRILAVISQHRSMRRDLDAGRQSVPGVPEEVQRASRAMTVLQTLAFDWRAPELSMYRMRIE